MAVTRDGICGTCGELKPMRLAGRDICNPCYLRERRDPALDGQPSERTFAPFIPTPWAEEALCAETDPEMFFPEKGGSTKEAKAVCGACLVRAECLDYALETGQRFGIWGGCSERERRRLLDMADDSEEASAA